MYVGARNDVDVGADVGAELSGCSDVAGPKWITPEQGLSDSTVSYVDYNLRFIEDTSYDRLTVYPPPTSFIYLIDTYLFIFYM